MTERLLHEAAGSLRAQEGGKWAVTLITPGKGSSGTYSETVLERDAATAFPQGMKLWFGHPKEGSGPGDRDPRDQWGVLDESAAYTPGEGITGKVRLLPHWKDVVESLGDQASLSIYAMGDSDADGNVTALHESMTNSVDIVSYPGREGSGLKQKLEAARAASPQPGSTSAPEIHTQEESMDEQTRAIEALTALLKAYLDEQKAASVAAAKAEADAKAEGKELVDALEAFAAAVKAISEAQLSPSAEADLLALAKKGEDVTDAIESEKKKKAEYVEAAKPAATKGYVLNESAPGAKSASDFVPKGW